MSSTTLSRRNCLHLCASTGLATCLPAWAQPGAKADEKPLRVVQIADMSAAQQDVSRDFVTGARAAWQEVNTRGGIRGRSVEHQVVEVQGSAPVAAAWRAAASDQACIALSGCVGHGTASALAGLAEKTPVGEGLVQIAPWLHTPEQELGQGSLFPVFPGYRAQIAHALKNLSGMGVQELGVVYATAGLRQQSGAAIAQAAQALALRVHTLPLPGSSVQADQALAAPAQVIVLFVGGTPELFDFARKLALPAGRHCYLVALADVNLQVLAQMGALARNVSVIATQNVPLVSASLPLVRAYRAALARWYDEPPSPQGLAGFVSARYTARVLSGVAGPITRAAVHDALRRRQSMDLDGLPLAFDGHRQVHAYVTQSMLTADGRIVG